MLIEWLKMISPQPTWERLMKALMEPIVGCQDLAVRIARKHDITLPAGKSYTYMHGKFFLALDTHVNVNTTSIIILCLFWYYLRQGYSAIIIYIASTSLYHYIQKIGFIHYS